MEQLEKDWKLMEMMVSFTWHSEKQLDHPLNNSAVSNNTVPIHGFKAFLVKLCFSLFKADSYYRLLFLGNNLAHNLTSTIYKSFDK